MPTTTKLSADELAEVSQPLAKLSQHVAIKGVQTGALVSLPFVALGLLRKRQQHPITWQYALRTASVSSVRWSVLTAAGSLVAMMALMMEEGFDDYRIWDRAYRIKYNESQNRCDRFSMVGGALGGAAMLHPAVRTASIAQSVAGGVCLGMAGGVVAHVVSNPKEDLVTATEKGIKSIETNAEELAAAAKPRH